MPPNDKRPCDGDENRQASANRRGFLRNSSLLLAGAVPQACFGNSQSEQRIGLIGDDRAAIKLAELILRNQPRSSLRAIAAPFADVAQRTYRSLNGLLPGQLQVDKNARLSGNAAADRLLDITTLDRVIVAGVPAKRAKLIRRALESGLQVTTVAPVAIDSVQLDHLESAPPNQLVDSLQIQSRLTANSTWQRRMTAVASGAFGEIKSLRIEYDAGFLPKYREHSRWTQYETSLRNWQHDDRLSGGQFLSDLIAPLYLSAVSIGLSSGATDGFDRKQPYFSIHQVESSGGSIRSIEGRLCLSQEPTDLPPTHIRWQGESGGAPKCKILLETDKTVVDLLSTKKSVLDAWRMTTEQTSSPLITRNQHNAEWSFWQATHRAAFQIQESVTASVA